MPQVIHAEDLWGEISEMKRRISILERTERVGLSRIEAVAPENVATVAGGAGYTNVLVGGNPVEVTVNTGHSAVVLFTARLTTNAALEIGYKVTGASTLTPGFGRSALLETTDSMTAPGMGAFVETELTPGENTFTLQAVDDAAGTFSIAYPVLIVIPLSVA